MRIIAIDNEEYILRYFKNTQLKIEEYANMLLSLEKLKISEKFVDCEKIDGDYYVLLKRDFKDNLISDAFVINFSELTFNNRLLLYIKLAQRV